MRRRRSVGVTGRLVALVMIPVTAICGMAMSVILSRRSAADGALRIDHGVVNLSALVELHASLVTQKSVEDFRIRIAELGVTPAAASAVIGDFAAAERPARVLADHGLAVLGRSAPIGAATLHNLEASIDAGRLTPLAAGQQLSRIDGSVATAIARGLGELETAARRTGADALDDSLEALDLTNGTLEVAAAEGIDLSAVWFPSPQATSSAPQAALARLGAESADYASASGRLRGLAVSTVVDGLAGIEADPGVQAFDATVAAALMAKPLLERPAATTAAATAFRGYLNRETRLNDLVLTATAAVRHAAQTLAASERRAFAAWLALAALVALSSLAVAIAIGRSIANPLRRLASYAHELNEGRLDAPPGTRSTGGPREIRVALNVFTELVANLQLPDAKAGALANCAFDDPVLLQPLPGRLGKSLASSVAVLSGSIVERDRLQTHLAHQASHDSLTGVANRAAAVTAIQEAIHRAARTAEPMALLFVDLNDFKSINDSYGHEAGDEVLRQVAARLLRAVRSGNVVARLGGDEFVVVAERIAAGDGAMELARRVLQAIEEPVDLGHVSVTVGAAIGVAITFDGPEDPLRLLGRADTAMYRAKHHDRSAIEMFDAELQRQMVEREDVEGALAEALSDPTGGGLCLHYQPVVQAETGAIVGVEALVRWERAGHGLLPPDAFVPIAEATSLIIRLDRWVLAEVGRRLASWSDDPELADMPIAVNISGRHLQSGQLAAHLATMIQDGRIEPRRLTIEITETVLLDDLGLAAAELDAVRALGIRVAIDDFGTGYTSLGHLQHLPIDMIKIDRSFVSQLHQRRGSSLVRMVTDLGHAIDLGIIAEGVETDEELSALRAMGADQIQGYLLSRPLEAGALKRWVHQQARTTWPPPQEIDVA